MSFGAAPFASSSFAALDVVTTTGTAVVRMTATAGLARYVGDSFTIAAAVATTTGIPSDVTSVTLTVRQPDGTTVGPYTATHGATGAYSYLFPAAQAGMHTATLLANGALAPVAEVDFYAYPTGGGSTGLVTLEEVRAELRISLTDLPKYSARLLSWIQASRVLIEEQVGDLTPTTHDEWYDGGTSTIVLLEAPVMSVTSVTETFGANVVRALTEQTLDGITPVDAYGYTLDRETGVMTRRVTGVAAPFALGRRNVRVVHTTGRAGVWRENFRLANLECLRTWWIASQQGSNPQAMNGDDSAVDYGGIVGELPPRVIRMLGRQTRGPGIA